MIAAHHRSRPTKDTAGSAAVNLDGTMHAREPASIMSLGSHSIMTPIWWRCHLGQEVRPTVSCSSGLGDFCKPTVSRRDSEHGIDFHDRMPRMTSDWMVFERI